MKKNSLVIFKSKAAKVIDILDKKIEIETVDGKNIKLPSKNVKFLIDSKHNFDLQNLKVLNIFNLEIVWTLLQDQKETSIKELSELLFESININEIYTVWVLVHTGEYFSFNTDFSIKIHSEEQKNHIILEKQIKFKKDKEINDFIERLKTKKINKDDDKFIKEIEALATLKTNSCRFLKHLNIEESEHNAYKLLLEIGYWNEFTNPYLNRCKIESETESKLLDFNHNDILNTQRVDLTHLKSYAIDDKGINDPDDAISWDFNQNIMWVHIADPSYSINFDSNIDIKARTKGSNLYLPEKIITMLPAKAIEEMALGSQKISKALSIGFSVDEVGNIINTKICFSNIQVIRYSYDFVEDNIKNLQLDNILKCTKKFTKKRLLNGAVELNFPEIKILLDGYKNIKLVKMPYLNSKILVRDSMLMAGVAVAQFCKDNNIPVPFLTQSNHSIRIDDLDYNINSIANMFKIRKKLQKSKYSTESDVHSGLGLETYLQVTSPLRRYLDLIVHYQLRNFLESKKMILTNDINNITSQVYISMKLNSQTERLSNLHWKLVYLMHNPNLEFEAVILEKLDRSKINVFIIDLAMTKKIFISGKYNLNDKIKLKNTSVNIVTQEAYFKLMN